MKYLKEKLYSTSVKSKVIAGFLLVFIAILLALAITRFGFREMMETVDQLSAPNKELNALKTLFQEITAIDQEQRAEALKNPKGLHKNFFNQSKSLVDKVDAVRLLNWDSAQQMRLIDIKEILLNRNRLFSSYLKLKSEAIENRTLNTRLDSITRMLVNERVVYDSSVITTEKKTTTTYTKDSVPDQKERSGLAKFFSRKKKVEPQTTHIKVEEELSVVVDTLSVARQNEALEEVERIIIDLETDQRRENQRLRDEELELIHANSILVGQLLSVLHAVEDEELAKMNQNNDHAVSLVTQSILRISILLIVFFISAAFLVYLIWVDITRSNYYKAQLEKARDEAEELTKIKQRFLANMSHEIRTPLQTIIGFSEQLKQNGGKDKDAVEAINSSSEHLLHIVDEVLDYSRISSGSFALSRENFQLMEVVKEVESALRIQAGKKGLMLLLDVEDAKEYNVSGDAFRLRQVLYNLLGNAIKFTSKGYVKLALKTREEKHAVQCYFEISDTGIGIRREDLSKIFNQFEQANTLITRNYGGTGLGLTIAKSLVEAQGGALEVSSVLGHGSTFKVSLAYDKAERIAEIEPFTAKDNDKSFRGKVIVVDDDIMILRLCGLILAKNEISFITFNDAKRLLDEKPDPDVTHILMDIRMPEINGIELCHELHKKYDSAIKFVALTAHVLPQEKQELLDEGFDAVLSKPFREQELLGLFNIIKSGNGNGKESGEVDLSTLRSMTFGDEALFQSIITQFIEETESDVSKLNESLSGLNAIIVREIIHKLAGRTGQMGMVSLSSSLKEIEVKLIDGVELTTMIEPINQANREVEKVLNAIKNHAFEQSSNL
jgi:signal transduction histidine kinase/HPt (histidine-containing phosphotransfer) domain-containing protein